MFNSCVYVDVFLNFRFGSKFESCLTEIQESKINHEMPESILSALLKLQEWTSVPEIEYDDLRTLIRHKKIFQCFQSKSSPEMSLDYIRGDGRHLTMEWNGDFTIDDHIIPLSGYQR